MSNYLLNHFKYINLNYQSYFYNRSVAANNNLIMDVFI